ncbi:MAG: hypothetical protein P8Q31_05735 [Luminiphilus sp.]|jgi:hypothetical protein|nr:hypothetical protein [Luminiphilus sp.]MDG1461007.1 hypothetical protein [Luminiphilus sp.]
MIKKLALVFMLCLTPLVVFSQDQSFDNFIDVELAISDVSMTAEGMVITYEGTAGKYGLVHATHNMVATNDENTKGYFTGTVQAINDKGVLEKSATLGLWSRDGTNLKVYGFDDDNSSRILHISTVDLRTKTFQARVWELD